jgi:hypothetical protein
MQGTQPRRPGQGSGASQVNQGIAAELTQATKLRDALAQIHAAIVATSRERPLSRLEIRIRCLSAPRPWADLGITYSGWHRRRRKQRMAAENTANEREGVAA